MELKDLYLTPLYLILIYAIAYWRRPQLTDKFTKKYYIPALTIKIVGAISLGLIYWFYYGNGSIAGDTFYYHKHAQVLNKAFVDSPAIWLKLMLSNGEFDSATHMYASQIIWYKSPPEFIIVKLTSLLSLITFSTYTVIALFFSLISFFGLWRMYQTFLKLYPNLTKEFAIAIFWLPSVFFWGSGLMKDSITIGALGWLFYGFYKATIEKKNVLSSIFIIFLAGYIIYVIKVYILLAFLPPALLWIFNENNRRIKNKMLRITLRPIFLGLGGVAAFFGATKLTEGDVKYDLENIGERTRINSQYLSVERASGSAYNIGTFDGSIQSMIAVAPQAVAVALYRPFLWEVRNPVMLLSALESTFLLIFTIQIFASIGFIKTIRFISSKPILTFSMLFCLVLAFAVGTNSGNFGSLVRYKIPLLPFYLAALFIIGAHKKKPKFN